MSTTATLFLSLAMATSGSGSVFDHTHARWSAVLAAHLRSGEVDYRGLKQDPGPLTAYLGTLEAVSREEYAGFSRPERLAFWINAYNAYTVKLILDHYPIQSIRKIGRLWESPFKIPFIPLARLRGKDLSLDLLEHEILRAEFQDPRVHAAIVCASKSCPALRGRAYTAAGIEAELEQAMRGFLADPAKNRFDPRTATLSLSSIFTWFRADFEKQDGTLAAYVGRYLPEAKAASQIEFLDYDWSLNGR